MYIYIFNILKLKYIFNKAFQKKYPFIKIRGICPSAVLCEKYATQFSVSYGGESDVQQHLRSEKHKNTDRAVAASFSLQGYFKNANTPTKILKLQQQEFGLTIPFKKITVFAQTIVHPN